MMAILEQVRQNLGQFLIHRRQYHTGELQGPVTLKNARSVAIIYNTHTANGKHKEIQEFAQLLKNQNRSVHLLEFLDEEDNTTNLFATKHFSFFTKIDLNFLHFPRKSAIENFTQHSYDLLICLCHKECLPLYYTAAITKASFKIGMYNPEFTHIFDLMFAFDSDDLKQNLVTIQQYLENIQKN